MREALTWNAVWVSLAFLFNLSVYYWQRPEGRLQVLLAVAVLASLVHSNIEKGLG